MSRPRYPVATSSPLALLDPARWRPALRGRQQERLPAQYDRERRRCARWRRHSLPLFPSIWHCVPRAGHSAMAVARDQGDGGRSDATPSSAIRGEPSRLAPAAPASGWWSGWPARSTDRERSVRFRNPAPPQLPNVTPPVEGWDGGTGPQADPSPQVTKLRSGSPENPSIRRCVARGRSFSLCSSNGSIPPSRSEPSLRARRLWTLSPTASSATGAGGRRDDVRGGVMGAP